MAMYENVLATEFTKMMNERKSRNSGFHIKDVITPDLGLITNDFKAETGQYGFVRYISEPYFDKLNSSCSDCPHYCNGECSKGQRKELCPRKIIEISKQRVFNKKIAMKDEEGNSVYRTKPDGTYMTREIKVEKGFVAIYSSVNIHLPNKEEDKFGRMRDVRLTRGYNFIDAVETPAGTRYIYTVPMEAVMKMELCALVISLTPHKARYKGCKVALSNGWYVYVYSIPYKYKENAGYKLIGCKASPDFDEEMSKLLDFWMEREILFDLRMCALDDQVKGKTNLALEDIPGTYYREDYNVSKGALKELDLEESSGGDGDFALD